MNRCNSLVRVWEHRIKIQQIATFSPVLTFFLIIFAKIAKIEEKEVILHQNLIMFIK